MTVVSIIESWFDEDRASFALANGVSAASECDAARTSARQRRDVSFEQLARLLPDVALNSVETGLASKAPRANTAIGETARRWRQPHERLAAAAELLKTAHRHQRDADARAEAEKQAEEAARLAAEEESRLRAARAALLAQFREKAERVFACDFLGADEWFDHWDTDGQVSRDDFGDWKAEFVQRWAREHLGDDRLDFEQAYAVATCDKDLRITARAGSGKTRTIVTRALVLQLHCRVDPGSIALVAFNNKAVGEISRRIEKALPAGVAPPHVVTFHALAYALLRPEEELVYDDEDSETLAQSAKVQAVVDSFLEHRQHDVRRAMLGHFRDDWERIVKRGLHLDRDEFFTAQAQVTRVTLGGEWVKSFGERLIANTLFEHGIDYKYERNFTRGGFNYRPDFTVFANGKARLVVEYFGLAGVPKYDRNAAKKREFWASQPDIAFLEFTPDQIVDLGEERFTALLLNMIRGTGVTFQRLTQDEIWERVHRRAVDTFSKALRTFVGRARQLDLDPSSMRQRIDSLGPTTDNRHFLDLAADVYEEYLRRASLEGYEDFSGVMWRATDRVQRGATNWTREGGKQRGSLTKLRFIHVDEFQDFSAMFMAFIQAIRSHVPHAVLCCVGDDWQAINRFAGADLTYFRKFEESFPGSATRALATNYRSTRSVVSAGNHVMAGLGDPARPHRDDRGRVQIARLQAFAPTIAERERFSGDIGTPALLRLVRHALDDGAGTGRVVVLFRRNTVPWYTAATGTFSRRLDGFRSFISGHFTKDEAKRIEVTTAHKYKGREADFVIIGDADARAYPLIHPTAELFEIFGDTKKAIVEDERRLFYVATTRAESSLVYLVTTDEPSPFLEGVPTVGPAINWTDLMSVVTGSDTHVEIRVYDGYDVRETLHKRFQFTFDEITKTWNVLRPAADFDFQHIRETLSFIGPRLIEVRDEQGTVLHAAGARLQ